MERQQYDQTRDLKGLVRQRLNAIDQLLRHDDLILQSKDHHERKTSEHKALQKKKEILELDYL